MDAAQFTRPSGSLVPGRAADGSRYLAFVPNPLPPPDETAAITLAGKRFHFAQGLIDMFSAVE
jgi:hypothetical protein